MKKERGEEMLLPALFGLSILVAAPARRRTRSLSHLLVIAPARHRTRSLSHPLAATPARRRTRSPTLPFAKQTCFVANFYYRLIKFVKKQKIKGSKFVWLSF